jgi:hypothetical protein
MEETQRLVAQRRGCKRPDQFTPSRTIDMRFELYPGTLRKIMSLDGSKVRRIISFETSLETPFQRSIFDYSNLKDGRSLSSLPCTTNIRPSDSEELSGTLTYVPKFSADDLNIHEPASLEIEVHLPLQAFDDLWNASHEGKEFLVGGQIEGIPNTGHFIAAFSSYEWDIEPEANRSKPLSSLWFGVLERPADKNDTKRTLQVLRASPDTSLEKLAEDLLPPNRYPERSQMRRICKAGVEQAQREAERRGLVGSSAATLISDTLDLIGSVRIGVRAYDAEGLNDGELWTHKDIANLHYQGRKGLKGWFVSRNDLAEAAQRLIQEGWLRLDELEWSIVDALTFNEVFEFGENLKGDLGSLSDAWAYAKSEGHVLRMQWERLKVRLLWLLIRLGTIAGAVWLVWQYANTSQHSTWDTISLLGGAALLLLWLFAAGSGGRSARINARMRRAELLSAMRDAYALTRPTSTMSPIQIRAALLRAQDKGAIWDSSAFALLDRAAMRQPPVWIPF